MKQFHWWEPCRRNYSSEKEEEAKTGPFTKIFDDKRWEIRGRKERNCSGKVVWDSREFSKLFHLGKKEEEKRWRNAGRRVLRVGKTDVEVIDWKAPSLKWKVNKTKLILNRDLPQEKKKCFVDREIRSVSTRPGYPGVTKGCSIFEQGTKLPNTYNPWKWYTTKYDSHLGGFTQAVLCVIRREPNDVITGA